MVTNLNANDPASLTLLQNIEAIQTARATSKRLTFQPFDVQGYRGTDLLTDFVQHLKAVSGLLQDPCSPPCDEPPGGCPPCENWDYNSFNSYLQKLQAQVGQ